MRSLTALEKEILYYSVDPSDDVRHCTLAEQVAIEGLWRRGLVSVRPVGRTVMGTMYRVDITSFGRLALRASESAQAGNRIVNHNGV